MSDHYRLGWEAVLAAAFALFLILFAGAHRGPGPWPPSP